jgi:tripartite-type tricarboxylate transporter receptor subunit TctC
MKWSMLPRTLNLGTLGEEKSNLEKAMRKSISALLAAGIALAVGVAWLPAQAQSYPSKPIRYVVPYPPGGTTDIISRLIAQKLTESFGQPVIVENKAGAGGVVGTDSVAKAIPDGYTILMGSAGPLTINPSLLKNIPYDPIRDFAPITTVAVVPSMLVVNPSVPANSVQDLIALAKARPGRLSFASTGNGGAPHLGGELFKLATNTDILHVPYKGSSPAVNDLLGGQISMMFEQIPAVLPHVKSGKLRALGVGGARRSPALPDTPTISEAGVPGFAVSTWFGVLAPGGTPAPIVSKLNAEIVRILNAPEMREKLTALGAELETSTPEQFAAMIKAEIDKWAQVIRKSGVKAD